MGPEAFSRWLETLSAAERAKLLVRISFELTIFARGCYQLNDSGHHERDGKVPLGFNELQHQLLSQAGHYIDGEASRVYPPDVFSRTVFDGAEWYGLTPILTSAMEAARRKTRATQP